MSACPAVATPGHVTVTNAVLKTAADTIDQSGVGPWIEDLLTAQRRGLGGHTRVLNVRALCVGLLLLAITEQPMILRDLVRTLNNLTAAQKTLLGIDGQHTITERMVSHVWNLFADELDPSPYALCNDVPGVDEHGEVRPDTQVAEEIDELLEVKHSRLREFFDRLLEATLPGDHTGSYALDATKIPGWARPPAAGKPSKSDPDASWKEHVKTDPDGKTERDGWFGYAGHAIVRVGEVGGTPVPNLVERLDITTARWNEATPGAALLTRMVEDHDKLDAAAGRPARIRRDILVDGGYSHGPKAFIWPAVGVGYTAGFPVNAVYCGENTNWGGESGIVVIDGQAYAPSIPAKLRIPVKAPPYGTRDDAELKIIKPKDIAGVAAPGARTVTSAQKRWLQSLPDTMTFLEYKNMIAQREEYLLPLHEKRLKGGGWRFANPGLRGLQVCPDAPRQRGGAPEPCEHQICHQNSVTLQSQDLPLWQPLVPGSESWYASFNRRSRVEGIFGNLKNEANADIKRGSTRILGLAKTGIMFAFVVAACNLRILARFRARMAAEAARPADWKKPTRAPRRRSQAFIDATTKHRSKRKRAADPPEDAEAA